MGFVPVGRHCHGLNALQRRIKPRQRLTGIVEMHVRVIEGAAVMGAQDEEADHFGIVFFQHFTNGEKIAERFRHFFIIDADETVVHPVVHEGAGMRAFRLGNLILMVRKLQILAAAVNVEMLAEQFGTHGRTFDVPARTAIAPGRSPERLALFGVLPEHEIKRVLLCRIDLDTLASAQVVERLAGKLAVAGKLAYRIIHVAVGSLVSQTVFFEFADQAEHLWHIIRGARFE